MAFKVAQLGVIPGMPDYEEMFRSAGVEVELVKGPPAEPTEDAIISTVGDADAVIAGTTVLPFSRRVLTSLSNCKFIMSIGVGYDKLDVQAATELGILAANIPDYCLEEVSDHAMALILSCTRRVVQLNELVKKGGWETHPAPYMRTEIWPKLTRLKGQTLGLIGLGRIARTLVPKAKGFGLKVIAYDLYVAPDTFRELGVGQVDLDGLLAQSDIISVHVPLSSGTTHLLGLEQLKKMKSTAYLINTARGPVVDHEALYTALSEGLIEGAAFDVTEPEPIPIDSPLLKLDNFIVTAHSAAISEESWAELLRRPADEVIRVAKGEWPVGLIDHKVKEIYRQRWGLGAN